MNPGRSPADASKLDSRPSPAGYTLPLSPTGESSFVTPPPWHFSGDFIWVDYQVNPDAVSGFMPSGATVGDRYGAAAAVFANWQWCSASRAELADPVWSQFGEFMLLLGCEHNGLPMARCAYAWVDSPLSLVRGWIQGMPKQPGVVRMSRAITVGQAGPRLQDGGVFTGTLAEFDRMLTRCTVTIHKVSADPPPLSTYPMLHSRIFPRWSSQGRSVSELVRSQISDSQFSTVWKGTADLQFDFTHLSSATRAEDLLRLEPVQVGSGYVFSYAETLLGGELLDAEPGR